MPQRTPFYDYHVSAKARMVDFAGWEMPILYRSIVDEHVHMRTSASLFDVSHMARFRFSGAGAQALLDRLITRNVGTMKVGQSRYSLVCNEAGGIHDDIIVSREPDSYFMVANAGNYAKLLPYFTAAAKAAGVTFDDLTASTAMIALQGPKVIEKLAEQLPFDLRALKRYHFETVNVLLTDIMVFRSGYTGEDGVELVFPAGAAAMAVKFLAGKADSAESTIRPAGLGARDTLRMEAGMPLYGHELDEATDPLSAGLGWAVDLTKPFVGSEALKKIAADGPKRKLVGLELSAKRIARQRATVLAGGNAVGTVTSGTLSPTLQKSIAMAYVEAKHAAEGTMVECDFKGSTVPATVVKLPFYKRS